MNSNLGKSSIDFDFDLGIGANRSRSLNDQKTNSNPNTHASNSTFAYSQQPKPTPWQPKKPSWTHQPSPAAAASGLKGEIGVGSGSMVGDITGKSWNSMGIGSSGGSIGIVKKDPNLFGDLVSSALGQGNRDSSNAPLKSVGVNAASRAGKGSFGMGGLGETLPKGGNNGVRNGNAGLKQGNSEQFGSFVSASTSSGNGGFGGGGGIGMNKGLNSGGIEASAKSVGGGGLSSSKDPFGSLVDFGSKPLGGGHVSSGSKVGSATNVNSNSKSGSGDFQNAPKSTSSGVSSNVFSTGNNKHTSSSSAPAFPMESFSSKNQVPFQSVGADSFDMFFPSSAVSSEAAKSGSGASVSQPFSDIGEDWGLESEFGGGDQDVGGTTELDGLPPPPAGVSALTAKNKGTDNQKQGQYADAIKWLSWAVILLEKAGDVNGTMEVLITRASCYKEVGEYKKAVADCTKVLDQDGKNVSVLVQRALLYESIEKYKLGAEDLRTVMKIDPGNRVARSTIHRLSKLAG
ncbi:Sperm-associated antigen 1A-like protein [Drosera capensis]